MIIKENNNKKQELSSCKNASNFNSSVFFRSPRCFRDIVLVKLMMSLRFHLNAGWVGSNLVGSNSDGVDVYQYIYIYIYIHTRLSQVIFYSLFTKNWQANNILI